MILGGIGVLNHSLPLLYLGAGLFAGLGLGLSYVPPISTLVKYVLYDIILFYTLYIIDTL